MGFFKKAWSRIKNSNAGNPYLQKDPRKDPPLVQYTPPPPPQQLRNPYSAPQTNPPASTSAPGSRSQNSITRRPGTPPSPASPRGSSDYLAKAREAARRDRVTGKKKAAYPVEGTDAVKHEQYVKEMAERRLLQVQATPLEFYAPQSERAKTEYYTPGAGRS